MYPIPEFLSDPEAKAAHDRIASANFRKHACPTTNNHPRGNANVSGNWHATTTSSIAPTTTRPCARFQKQFGRKIVATDSQMKCHNEQDTDKLLQLAKELDEAMQNEEREKARKRLA